MPPTGPAGPQLNPTPSTVLTATTATGLRTDVWRNKQCLQTLLFEVGIGQNNNIKNFLSLLCIVSNYLKDKVYLRHQWKMIILSILRWAKPEGTFEWTLGRISVRQESNWRICLDENQFRSPPHQKTTLATT